MPKSYKALLTELSWLAISLIVTILIAIYILNWTFLKSNLDIHLNDTYYIFSAVAVILPLFLLMTFLLFSIKEARNGFGRTFPNIIILISGLLLITLIIVVNKEILKMGRSGGWTVYPPLSALPHVEPGNSNQNSFVAIIINTLTVLQLIVTISLLYIAFRYGTQRKKST
ncbi:MAG: hypothetical protein M3352_00565 [Bacteroidota bacterium]|nr:hypothetical protein [Bacteroidota bacterium]